MANRGSDPAGARPAWRWELRAPADSAGLAPPWSHWGVPAPLARLLHARGFRHAQEVDRFLRPRLSDLDDPFRLPDMPRAVARIARALAHGEPIAVFGDYDADGITATALLTRCLQALGARVTPFLPHRIADGYGFRPDTARRCAESLQPRLIITVDCGTNAAETVVEMTRMGIEVVITDHHLPSSRGRPEAAAVVNPRYAETRTAWSDLAGVGVAFKLCHALVKEGRQRGWPGADRLDLREWLDLVAIGTIADIVPLLGENRILARHGIDRLNRAPLTGLRTLREIAGVRGEVDTYHIGFLLAPRLNAVGRLDSPADAFALLMTDDAEEAVPLAQRLDASNRDRQQLEARTWQEAEAWVARHFDPTRDYGIVVAGVGWHPGIVGLVASRLCKRYGRPSIAIAINENGDARGSCRSIEAFPILDALHACTDLLDSFGGHALAAGLTLSEDRIEAFRQRFCALARERLAGTDLRPTLPIDQWIALGEADDALLEAVLQLRPFGVDNPAPVWAVRCARVLRASTVGEGGRHLRLILSDGGAQREAIGFNMGDFPLPSGTLDVAFTLEPDDFNGQRKPQLKLVDIRPSSAE